ncbi:MAG: hypothetical protein ACI8T1_002410 [Verrucomicrobiales bacterium]
MLAAFAAPWAHSAKTPLDQTRTRIALPMDKAPIIDGVIDVDDEWAQVVANSWSITIADGDDGGDGVSGGGLGGGTLPDDDVDLSATIYAGISDGNLFIGVRVMDEDISTDTVEAGSENGMTWQDDGVEIFIDGDNSNFPTRETTGENPEVVATGGQFVITANNAYRHAEAGNPKFDPSSGWFAETKIEEGVGYHAEFRIPLTMMGNPQQGEHIGFTVRINDEDGGGDATESVLTWVGVDHVEETYGNLVIGHRRYEGIKATPPVVDGKVNDDEYPGAEVVEINPATGIFVVGDDSTEEDNRYAWRMTHDQEAIYIGIKVWDTQIVADTAEPNSEDQQTWVDDSVEIFFDSNESNKVTRIVPEDELYDGQFVFTTNGAWRDAEANNPTYGENADWWAQSTVADDGMSYEIEFVVKKATLVGGNNEDVEMGFNININDDDAGGGRKLQLNWDGVPHFEDSYGTLVLLSAIPSDPNAVTDRSVRFGQIDVGTAAGSQQMAFRNAGGTQALTLSDPEITGPDAGAFTIVDFPTEIAPGESEEATINFDSSGITGSFNATLSYKTNDPDPSEADLTATLTASVLNLAGPIARWAFDETDGSEMLDITGFNRHGVYEGATLGQEALATGTSALFGGGTYGEVPGETFDSFIRFSVAMWVNLSDLSDNRTLFAKGVNGGAPTFALLNADGKLQWFTEGSAEFETANVVITANITHHVVATWDTTQASIYVDGVEVASQADPIQIEILQENPFLIGSFFGGLNLEGRIDDVQFYNRAISAENVTSLFEVPGRELTNAEGGSAVVEITWSDVNPDTKASDLIGGPNITFVPFTYEPAANNADNAFWTGDGGTTGNAELDGVYNSHGWNGDGSAISLEGLTAGNDYKVQLLGAGDTRACCGTRNQAASDGTNVSNDFARGNSSVIGSFTAGGPTQEILIISGTDNGVDPGLSGFILTDASGSLISAFNVGRTEGGDISVATVEIPVWAVDKPGTLPADSAADFGGPDVDNGWSYGYRNVPLDDQTDDYDPFVGLNQFSADWWTGNGWDEPNVDGDNVPWTAIAAGNGHPNGDNNGELHWTIRRWTSPGGSVDVTWSISKENVTCGNGVTGGVHHNGVLVDSETLEFDDGAGVTRTVSIDTEPGDVIDLIHSPLGTDDTNNDGCDGSLSSMMIEEGTGGGGESLDVLFLGADETGETGADANVLAFLGETFGVANTRYQRAGAADGSETADVIVFSSTFGSGDVRGKFHNSPVPIVNWEEAVMDTGDGEFGQSLAVMTKSTDTTQMALGDHPIAGDLAGTTIDYLTAAGAETIGSTELSSGTDTVSTGVDGAVAGLAMLFVTEAGAAVADTAGITDNVSPARRVAFPMTDATFDSLTDAGKQLFANSIHWAAGTLGGGGGLPSVVDLDASGLAAGAISSWTNAGSLGGDFQASGDPMVEVIDGVNAVTLDGDGDFFEGPTSPPEIDGTSARSIVAWVYNPELASEETVISWGKRGGPDGTNMAFNHGFHNNFGAVGHWGGDGPDIGWNPNSDVEGDDPNSPGDAEADVWTHISYTQTGTETKVFTNGKLSNSEGAVLDTFAGLGILVGAQRDDNGAVTDGLKGSLSIARVRVFDSALSDGDVLADFESSAAAFGRDVGGGVGGDRFNLENVGITANGVFGATVPDGVTADIEYSTDLVNWEVIAPGVTGAIEETAAARTAAPSGYYRARQN